MNSHQHYKVICKDCEDIINQCSCDDEKTISYEICDECLISQTKQATSSNRVEAKPTTNRQQVLAFTDMPFEVLGDIPHQVAPIRQIELLAYDGDKYVTARSGEHIVELKSGYVYTEQGRCGNVDTISYDILNALPSEYDGPVADHMSFDDMWERAKDAVYKFMHDDRKNDEDFPMGAIEEAIGAGAFTVDELASAFSSAVLEYFE